MKIIPKTDEEKALLDADIERRKREREEYKAYREMLTPKRQIQLIQLLVKELSNGKTEEELAITLKRVGFTNDELDFYL